jgi:hypothetical protein
LLTSWEEVHEGGFVRISVSGEKHLAAVVNAVVANYEKWTGRQTPTAEQLDELTGFKVTVLVSGENAFGGGQVKAEEGRIFRGTRGIAILPKGKTKNGHTLANVLDVFEGYGHTGDLGELVEQAKSHVPKLKPLTRERFAELPRPDLSTDQSPPCTLAVYGSYPTPVGIAPASLFVFTEYEPEDDIVDGMLYVSPEYGTSEHGSQYGSQMLSMNVGEVVDFEPISFREAIKLDDDYDESIARVLRGALPAMVA